MKDEGCQTSRLAHSLHPSSFILSGGGIFSVALSLSLRTVGVTHHRVLWSPDFPLPGPPWPEATAFQAAIAQPACGLLHYNRCCRHEVQRWPARLFPSATRRHRIGRRDQPVMSIQTIAWDETPPASCRGGAVAVGNFNGVHRGHLALLAELRKQADVLKGPAVAVTFDPHPLQLLRPEKFLPVLTTVAERARLLAANGADHVVILRTTRELLQLSAREFFDQVIRRGFGVRTVAEGVNFGFGRNREGNVETLKRCAARRASASISCSHSCKTVYTSPAAGCARP